MDAGSLGNALRIPRDVGQTAHVLEQDAAALKIENAVLAPLLELPVDALARRADVNAELLLGDMDLRPVIVGERA